MLSYSPVTKSEFWQNFSLRIPAKISRATSYAIIFSCYKVRILAKFILPNSRKNFLCHLLCYHILLLQSRNFGKISPLEFPQKFPVPPPMLSYSPVTKSEFWQNFSLRIPAKISRATSYSVICSCYKIGILTKFVPPNSCKNFACHLLCYHILLL